MEHPSAFEPSTAHHPDAPLHGSVACGSALRATSSGLLTDLNALGLLFESLVVRDLRVYAQPLDGEVFHYRDQSGLEVDAIVDTGDRWAGFEVKLGSGQIDQAAANLQRFADRVDSARRGEPSLLGVIVGSGYGYVRADGIHVIPIGALGRSRPSCPSVVPTRFPDAALREVQLLTLIGSTEQQRPARCQGGLSRECPTNVGELLKNTKAPHMRGLPRCAEEDSNLHPVIPDQALNLARLPIPPSARVRRRSIALQVLPG